MKIDGVEVNEGDRVVIWRRARWYLRLYRWLRRNPDRRAPVKNSIWTVTAAQGSWSADDD